MNFHIYGIYIYKFNKIALLVVNTKSKEVWYFLIEESEMRERVHTKTQIWSIFIWYGSWIADFILTDVLLLIYDTKTIKSVLCSSY